MRDLSIMRDELVTAMDSRRGGSDLAVVEGLVLVELFDERGKLKHREVAKNLITDVGDTLYVSRGAGLTSSALPIGMKLGTGSTAPAKNGAGAALATYLANSHLAFDSAPVVALSAGNGATATYTCTYAAGKATSPATAITEAVIYTDATADATSTAANTIARLLMSGVNSKQAGDSLKLTWTNTIKGA